MLSTPPFDLGWLAWGAFVPWILLLEECSPRQAFRSGYLIGLIFFGGTLWWVGHVTVPGAILLPAALALYFAAWGWLANRFLQTRPLLSTLLLPAAWTALEYLRSHLLSGFGWNLLAHTQWNWTEIIQLAGFTGVWGVSFLVVLANTALCGFLQRRKKGWVGLLLAGLCLLAAFLYGRTVLRELDAREPRAQVKIALLQGNIPQPEKWDESFQEAIWKRYEELMAEAAKEKPDLIVWPETAVPGYLEDFAIEDRLKTISRSAGAEMLVGLPTEDLESGLPYNSALLLGQDGEERARYSKIHLVPFGEFIPFKPVLGWLKKFYPVADFAPGKEWTVFPTPPPVSVLVCFEDLFPELARRFTREGAGWLLVITNDAWFGRSAASVQHLQASVFRAVENGVWLGRAANTGWTGFVDPAGRRLPPPGQIPRFKPGVAVTELPVLSRRGTFYTRWGDWFPILCLGLTVLAFIMKSPHGNSRSV
ncbi:MAG: apolipoprotein N-acyltransferase [Candidatus Omnitrophota bacterium]|nr:apolipoprotein N-acyltransferase [Candidatus Omnitrophota bacterium]